MNQTTGIYSIVLGIIISLMPFFLISQNPPIGKEASYLGNNLFDIRTGQKIDFKVTLKWVQVAEDEKCCGEKIYLDKYYNMSVFDEDEKGILKKELQDANINRNSPLTPTLSRTGQNIQQQGGFEDFPHKEEVFEWNEEDEKVDKGVLDSFFNNKDEYQAPKCECLEVTRYQLQATYEIGGINKLIDRFVHVYHDEQITSPGECDLPECKEPEESTDTSSEAPPNDIDLPIETIADVYGPFGNHQVQIEQRWNLLWVKEICCGETLTENYYVNSSEFSKEEVDAMKRLNREMRMNQFGGGLASLGSWLKRRSNLSGDLENLEVLFEWTEDDPHVYEEGSVFGNMGFKKSGKKIEFTAPECECLNIKRYQLFVTYDKFQGAPKVDHYVHKYREETQTKPAECDDPECNEIADRSSPITMDPKVREQLEKDFGKPDLPQEGDHYSIVPSDPLGLPPGAEATATGTGRTTGHIADLNIYNPTNEEIRIVIGPLYIPSSGKYQSYIVVEPIVVTVPPGAEVSVPINGYCADIYKPPVPAGVSMVPPKDWITPENAVKLPEPGTTPNPESPFKPLPEGKNPVVNYPGTNVPFPYTIDMDKHPESAASFILPAAEMITQVFGELDQQDQINTPYKGNPELQKETSIQQAVWLTVSMLGEDPYTKEKFEENLEDQFEASTGVKMEDAPPEQKEKFSEGADNFWVNFELIGTTAKILREPEPQEETPISDIVSSNSTDKDLPETESVQVESNDCCDRIRQQNDGNLRFNLGNGQHVSVQGNSMTIHLTNPASTKTIEFEFDLEAAICNLKENQVFGEFSSASGQATGPSGVREAWSSSDISIVDTSDDEASDPHYSIQFARTVNGEELAVGLTIDKRTCKVDGQVYDDGRLVEHTEGSTYSPDEIRDKINEQSFEGDNEYFNRMLFLLLQIAKEDSRLFEDAEIRWRASIQSRLRSLINSGNGNSAMEALFDRVRNVESTPEQMVESLIGVING